MVTLILIAVIGLLAQLIDGGLGMGYGVISTSLLLVAGLTPAAASASVHLAEIGTTLASGLSHWRFGNIDWKVVLFLAVPGGIGAFLGATALSQLSTESAAPWTSGILIVLGLVLLLRFSGSLPPLRVNRPRPGSRFLTPLGFVAGAVDATGGGGWGPVATSTLLASGRLEPRKTIGSVSASEFIVTVAASLGFVLNLGGEQILWPAAAALLVGGIIVAPFAAWLVKTLPTWLLGVLAGGVILATNANTILRSFDAPTGVFLAVFAAVAIVWGVSLTIALRSRPTLETSAVSSVDDGPEDPETTDAAKAEPEPAAS
ncbi:sulfite exporter TauE/SafE family protein [Stackebrandtia soli]|uniref:sulfite exporter TauE/SafE family protein n=1 Tax=Stackebrandtia soli TaxID=1892856 RepID=UPI0039E9FA6C